MYLCTCIYQEDGGAPSQRMWTWERKCSLCTHYVTKCSLRLFGNDKCMAASRKTFNMWLKEKNAAEIIDNYGCALWWKYIQLVLEDLVDHPNSGALVREIQRRSITWNVPRTCAKTRTFQHVHYHLQSRPTPVPAFDTSPGPSEDILVFPRTACTRARLLLACKPVQPA